MSEDTEKAPRAMRFTRSRSNAPKLSTDAAKRQGEIVHFAFLTLGGRDAAMEFLNNPDSALGGRPIDVAIASADGAANVTRAIKRLAENQSTDQ